MPSYFLIYIKPVILRLKIKWTRSKSSYSSRIKYGIHMKFILYNMIKANRKSTWMKYNHFHVIVFCCVIAVVCVPHFHLSTQAAAFIYIRYFKVRLYMYNQYHFLNFRMQHIHSNITLVWIYFECNKIHTLYVTYFDIRQAIANLYLHEKNNPQLTVDNGVLMS